MGGRESVLAFNAGFHSIEDGFQAIGAGVGELAVADGIREQAGDAGDGEVEVPS